MKLISALNGRSSYHDGTTSRHVSLIFEDDGETVVKNIKISDCSIAVNKHDIENEAYWLIVRSAREAVRDFAFKKHGPKGWRGHVVFVDSFPEKISKNEREIVRQAIELLKTIAHVVPLHP